MDHMANYGGNGGGGERDGHGQDAADRRNMTADVDGKQAEDGV